MAEFISFVINLVNVTVLLTRSISIHSDYQGMHFGKSSSSCLFMITEYWDANPATNYHSDVTNPLWHYFL